MFAENERTDDVRSALRKYYRTVFCLHPDWLALVDQEKGIQKAKEKLISEIPTTLVWKELDKPREAHMLIRGQYDKPGDLVDAGNAGVSTEFPGRCVAGPPRVGRVVDVARASADCPSRRQSVLATSFWDWLW